MRESAQGERPFRSPRRRWERRKHREPRESNCGYAYSAVFPYHPGGHRPRDCLADGQHLEPGHARCAIGVDAGRTQDRSATALPARRIRAGQRLAQQITDQDLFAPDRKRPVVVQQTVSAEPPPPPSHLTLVGVLLTPGREEAFLADSSQGNRVTRVQKGEQIGDLYRLTRLTAAEATLSLGDDGKRSPCPWPC